MHLQRDVLPPAERPAGASEHETHLVLRETEAGGGLLAVLVQPLRRDEELHPRAAGIGQRKGRLGAEERLVLHADLVRALDDERTRRVGVAAPDRLMADDVAVGVDRRMPPGDGNLGIEQRVEHVVGDDDGGQRASARLGVIGRHGRERFADVAHDLAGEHRLVLADEPVGGCAGDVGSGDDRLDPVDRPRAGDVDRHDARIRMR